MQDIGVEEIRCQPNTEYAEYHHEGNISELCIPGLVKAALSQKPENEEQRSHGITNSCDLRVMMINDTDHHYGHVVYTEL